MADTPQAEALLPCPFCGAQANVHVAKDGCSVTCSNCMSGPDTAYRRAGELDEAAAAWNTRAAQPVEVAPDDEALIVAYDAANSESRDFGDHTHRREAREALRRRIAGLRHIEWLMNYGGIIEVAVRNPNVKSYMEVWEKRAETAEAALAGVRDKTIEECAAVCGPAPHEAMAREWVRAGELFASRIRALKKEPTNG